MVQALIYLNKMFYLKIVNLSLFSQMLQSKDMRPELFIEVFYKTGALPI